MAVFSKGQTVKLNVAVPQGTVQAMRMDDDGNIECLLQWVDAAGNEQQRWFPEADLIAA